MRLHINCISALVIKERRVLLTISHKAADNWELILEFWSKSVIHGEVVGDQSLLQKMSNLSITDKKVRISLCRKRLREEHESYRWPYLTHSVYLHPESIVFASSINTHGGTAAEKDAQRWSYKGKESKVTVAVTSTKQVLVLADVTLQKNTSMRFSSSKGKCSCLVHQELDYCQAPQLWSLKWLALKI